MPTRSQWPVRRSASAGRDAAEFAEEFGLFLDDWQLWVLDGMLSEDVATRLVATVCVLLLPRQNGKNAVLEAIELYALYVLDVPLILHTAHLQTTSASHMGRLKSLITAHPTYDGLTKFIDANGKERIERLDTGSQIKFMTRSKKIGRGGSPAIIVFDEALYLSDEALQSILPSLSAQSMNDDAPMMIYTSSAPLGESEVLHRIRNACLAGSLPNAFFAEWSCDLGADINDVDVWYATNPGMGIRISEDWVRDEELPILKPEAFMVERLGLVLGLDARPSELPEWHDCLDEHSQIVGDFHVAVDVSDDLVWSSISVAGRREDGRSHVEVVERLEGTASVVPILVKMGQEVWLDPRSAAAGLIAPLERAQVKVREVTTADYVAGCALLRQAVQNGTVRHRGQEDLNVAVTHAAIRAVGDAWVWARRSSLVDISPLVASTLAHFAAAGKITPTPDFFTLEDE